jgi:O-antigen ligase
MTIWLFVQAISMTSLSCFLLGSVFLFASGTRIAKRQWATYLLMAVMVAVPFATLFMGVGGVALAGMGRDATLTGRTEIWKDVLSMAGNPIIGTGFESFWLGERADRMWKIFYFHPTQAHNGYIEIYLELGWVGIALMALIIINGCRNAVAMRRWDPIMARIRLTYIVIGLAYNMTEAGFRMMTLTWFFFLLSVVSVPKLLRRSSNLHRPSSAEDSNEPQMQGLPVPDFAGTI